MSYPEELKRDRTPGPWRSETHLDEVVIYGPHPNGNGRERVVARCPVSPGTWAQEAEGNARVMKAAPQLLEALEACQWNGRNCMDEPRCPVCYAHKDEGHTKDCIVGAAIRAVREGEP